MCLAFNVRLGGGSILTEDGDFYSQGKGFLSDVKNNTAAPYGTPDVLHVEEPLSTWRNV